MRTTKVKELKSREIVFQSVSRANTVNMNAPLLEVCHDSNYNYLMCD
jgi:hypothetical protein